MKIKSTSDCCCDEAMKKGGNFRSAQCNFNCDILKAQLVKRAEQKTSFYNLPWESVTRHDRAARLTMHDHERLRCGERERVNVQSLDILVCFMPFNSIVGLSSVPPLRRSRRGMTENLLCETFN